MRERGGGRVLGGFPEVGSELVRGGSHELLTEVLVPKHPNAYHANE